MNIEDLEYTYPESLVALKPQEPCRVLSLCEDKPKELELREALNVISEGDLLVVNNSGVKSCRVFFEGSEFLFLGTKGERLWEVLFKSAKFKLGHKFELPGGVTAELVVKGRPQVVKLDQDISEDYFETYGEFAIPPYIQKLRESRRTSSDDQSWYQLDWKKNINSLAAPTASLHFREKDLETVSNRGVHVAEVSLDVGLGTFLPLEQKNFDEQKLHSERFFIPRDTKEKLSWAKSNNRRIWALGTTALRAVESFDEDQIGVFAETDLFIQPGYKFKWVNGLFTNFHQPGSSLLALVMAFNGVEETKKAYAFAVKNKFRLFSYGDLSIWKRPL